MPERAGRRLGLVTIDQALSGGSNVLAAVIAARLLPPAQFGAFALALLVFGLVQGIFRSVVCTPALVAPDRAAAEVRDVVGGTWLFSVGFAVPLAVLGLVAGLADARLGTALVVLSVFLPLLLLQDLARFLAIASLRPERALWTDAVWLVLLVGGAVVLELGDVRSIGPVMAMWAGTGALAGLIAAVQWRELRAIGLRSAWLTSNWHLSWRFTVSYASAQLAVVLLAVLIRGVLGPVELGALLGAQVLMRPYATVETAVVGAGTAEIAHARATPELLPGHLKRFTVVALVMAGLNAAAMVLVPDAIGERLLGATWANAEALMLPFAAQLLCMSLAVGPRVGLLGVGDVVMATRISVGFMVPLVVGAVLGALLGGIVASAWTVAASWALASAAWWLALRRSPAMRAAMRGEALTSP